MRPTAVAPYLEGPLLGRSRMKQHTRLAGSVAGSVENGRAAKLAAIPAGESPANRGVQSLL